MSPHMGLAGNHRGLHPFPGAAGGCQVQETEGNPAACSLKVNSFTLQCSSSPAATPRGHSLARSVCSTLQARVGPLFGRWLLAHAARGPMGTECRCQQPQPLPFVWNLSAPPTCMGSPEWRRLFSLWFHSFFLEYWLSSALSPFLVHILFICGFQ